MISVIIPIYRVEAYLDRCVESIRSQTDTDLEIILVDDGSPDRCGEICDRYASIDDRIRVVHQENRGLSGARNAGLETACGEFVCFVDGDDEIDPGMLKSMEHAIRSDAYDLAICGYRRFAGNEAFPPAETGSRGEPLTEKALWEEVFGRLNNAAWGKLYRRELIGDLRFPEGMIHGEDLIFNLRYLTHCKNGVILNAPYYHYRIREDSITRSVFRESRFDEIKAKDAALELIKAHRPEFLETAKVYCFRARMNVLRALYAGGEEKNYAEKTRECTAWVQERYAGISGDLRRKERIEFRLFRFAKPLYRLLARRRAAGKEAGR
jgi:glycosyltransferase involved in cell wall biosynthesis